MAVSQKVLLQEFKAPLIAIIGMTELLRQSSQTEEQQALTNSIEQSASSLLNQINKYVEDPDTEEPPPPESIGEVTNELRELVSSQSSSGTVNPNVAVSQIKVLVVEDNPLLQLVVMKQLAHLGIRAEAVGEATAAINRAQEFDLIFMDCRLPGINGFEATRSIRESESESAVQRKIVALTAGYEDNTREKCLESGMDDCLIKPVGSQALKRVIERWFRLD